MSFATVQRALPINHPLLVAASESQHPIASFFKNFFYKLITFGFGRSLSAERSSARQTEIAHVAKDLLINLPDDFAALNKAEHPKEIILHTNHEQGYQITLEGKGIVLYKKGSDIRDENSRTCLFEFSTAEEFNNFVKHLQEAKEHEVLNNLIDTTISDLRNLKIYEKSLLQNLDDIAAQFICDQLRTQPLLVQNFYAEIDGKIKFSDYEEYEDAKKTGKIGADDLMPIKEFLIRYHSELKSQIHSLHIDKPHIYQLIDDNLYLRSRADPNLNVEIHAIGTLHGISKMGFGE